MFFSTHPKLIERMVEETPKAIVGLSVLSIIFLLIYYNHIPNTLLTLWLILQSFFIYLRFRNSKLLAIHLQNNNIKKINILIKQFYFLLICSAFIWNFGAIIGLFYAGKPYEFISFTLIIGLLTAGTMSLSFIFRAYILYFIFMLVPQLIVIYRYHDSAHNAILLLAIVYIPFILMIAKSINKNLIGHIKDNDKLAKNINKLHKISITDNLTQIYNRHYFFDIAKKMLNLGMYEEKKVSLLMLDIDYFKKINDTYGHQAGDMVLRSFSKIIQNSLRKNDVFARIGGEEFVVLLYDTSYNDAKNIARNICKIINEHTFSYEDKIINTTVSVGMYTTKNNKDTLDILYKEADKQLYLAKSHGRNCVF